MTQLLIQPTIDSNDPKIRRVTKVGKVRNLGIGFFFLGSVGGRGAIFESVSTETGILTFWNNTHTHHFTATHPGKNPATGEH